jgi:hypothetical protein
VAISVFPPASSGGAAPIRKTLRITSTQSWTAPADVYSVEVFMVSGGGGGGGFTVMDGAAGGGGGGGGFLRTNLEVSPSTSYTLTVGAGGSAGGSSSNGADGAATSFGSLLSIPGGGKGSWQGGQITSGACGGGHGIGNSPAYGGHGGGMGSIPRGPSTVQTQSAGPEPSNPTLQNASYGFWGTTAATVGQRGNPGLGLSGYCGGGMGGYGVSALSGGSAISEQRNHGGGWGATATQSTNQPAGSGLANTGGGGGGSARNNNFSPAAGNGGSGFMEITYWTAAA